MVKVAESFPPFILFLLHRALNPWHHATQASTLQPRQVHTPAASFLKSETQFSYAAYLDPELILQTKQDFNLFSFLILQNFSIICVKDLANFSVTWLFIIKYITIMMFTSNTRLPNYWQFSSLCVLYKGKVSSYGQKVNTSVRKHNFYCHCGQLSDSQSPVRVLGQN